MSTRADDLIRWAEQGARVKAIREALEMNGDEFAARLEHEARVAFQLNLPFDKFKLSRLEGGTRRITVEDAVILTRIDPEHRTVAWLVFGVSARRATVENPRESVVKGRGSNGGKKAG